MLTYRKTAFPLILFIIIVLLGGLLAACGRIQESQSEDADGVTIEMALEPEQPGVGPANLIFTLADQTGQPINNATLEVEGNMTHAGMTPVFSEASTGEDGRSVVPFEWTMGGDWFVTVDVTLPDGQEITREFPVTVSSNAGQ